MQPFQGGGYVPPQQSHPQAPRQQAPMGQQPGQPPSAHAPQGQPHPQGQPYQRQAPQGQQPMYQQQMAPTQRAAQNVPASGGSSFPYVMAAKIDTQGLIWMLTGVLQAAYGLVTAVFALIQFIQGKQNFLLFYAIGAALVAIIGGLNYMDGKKRKDNAGWVIANANRMVEEYSPLSQYFPSFLRNGLFIVALSLGMFPFVMILTGLLGLIGLGFLINIRYHALKQVQGPGR